MKAQIRSVIYAYFRNLGRQGGSTVQPDNLLSPSVKHQVSVAYWGLYAEVVDDLVGEGFLSVKPPEGPSANSLGTPVGYAITDKGITML